jgi:acetate kinase
LRKQKEIIMGYVNDPKNPELIFSGTRKEALPVKDITKWVERINADLVRAGLPQHVKHVQVVGHRIYIREVELAS